MLELSAELPTLSFDELKVFGEAHWKIAAVDAYASGRPAAWIDDSLDERCHAWARTRSEPTLLVETNPAVGITEEQARERKIEYKVGKYPFLPNGRAKAMDETEGIVKILADARTDRVLGVHIVEP